MNEEFDEKQIKKHREIVHKIRQFIKQLEEDHEKDKIQFPDSIIGQPNITCYIPTILKENLNE